MSHYLKTLMDCIFGEDNFRNEIVWNKGYRGTARKNRYQQEHDIILFYASKNSKIWNKQTVSYKDKTLGRYNKVDEEGKRYALIKRRKTDGTVYYGKCYPQGKLIGDVITIPTMASTDKERTGYPTQKPLALLDRFIKASSNEGDIVLDPFCGCATTCVASEMLDRKWIGIDISFKAYELVNERLINEVANPGDVTQYNIEVFADTRPPIRTDQDVDYREKKFVYVVSNPKYPEEYKVGIASDWRSRLNAYQTSDPDRAYKMEHKLETPDFRTLEKHIHNKFPNKHEWVQADLRDIIEEMKNFKVK